jgi:cell division initiation protein
MNQRSPETRITALQVEKTTFRRRFRGYDRGQVTAFLREVANELERLTSQLREMQSAERGLQAEVERYRGMEATLKEALTLAQKTADETRAAAHREAEALLAETRAQCTEMEAETGRRVAATRAELARLATDRDSLVAQLRAMVDAFATRLSDLTPASSAVVSMEAGDAGDGASASSDAEGEA